MNGQLYHGHHFLAGEIGLMCMGPQYVDKDFGSRGCLETLSGGRAQGKVESGGRGLPRLGCGAISRRRERRRPGAQGR